MQERNFMVDEPLDETMVIPIKTFVKLVDFAARPIPTDMVKEFHEVFGHPIGVKPDQALMELRYKLLADEVVELAEEVQVFMDTGLLTANFIKELADVQYVLSGFAIALGIDLDKATELVHESNLTKLDEFGNPIYREDGKVLKGPFYEEPDLSSLMPTWIK